MVERVAFELLQHRLELALVRVGLAFFPRAVEDLSHEDGVSHVDAVFGQLDVKVEAAELSLVLAAEDRTTLSRGACLRRS